MKRILLLMCTFALVFSCAKPAVPVDGALAELDLSLSLPAAKAMSDGKTVNKVVCAVYENGVEISDVRQVIDVENGVVMSGYKPVLHLGRIYQLVFWACYEGYYDVSDMRAISPVTVKGADEQADAFSATLAVQFNQAGQKENVTLSRPLARFNVAVPVELWNEKAEYVRVTADVPESYDALSASGSAKTETVTFTSAVSLETGVIDGKECRYLTYAYLFPAESTSVKVEVSSSKAGSFGADDLIVSIEEAGVRLSANTNTNLVGDVFADEFGFSMTISPEFTNPDINIGI